MQQEPNHLTPSISKEQYLSISIYPSQPTNLRFLTCTSLYHDILDLYHDYPADPSFPVPRTRCDMRNRDLVPAKRDRGGRFAHQAPRIPLL